MGMNDFFDDIIRKGEMSGSVKPQDSTRGNRGAHTADPMQATSFANVDKRWAEGYMPNQKAQYFDYYFAGQDIKVTIDGVEEDFPTIPIVNFAFNVQQQKTPVYGLWSYTYDGVMRGTRIVSGSFTIATRSTGYMTNLLSKAAKSRQDIVKGAATGGKQLYDGQALTRDDENIAKYWGKNIDPAVGRQGGKNMFSVHPPFSFVVLYGLQNTSISYKHWDPMGDESYVYGEPLHQDVNERLVEALPNEPMRYVLEACELQSMQTGFAPDGTVCAETYQFFARDLVIANTPSGGSNGPIGGLHNPPA